MTTEPEKKVDPRTKQFKRVRLSFTESLYEKKATVKDGEPKHGCNIIIEVAPGSDPIALSFADSNKQLALEGLQAAGQEQWGKPDAWKGIQEDNPKRICFRKGERFKNTDDVVYKGYEGNFAISASGPRAGRNRPKLWDRHKRPVEEKDILAVMYSGSYADVIVSFYGTDEGGRGIFASIEAIRSHQEGEMIGGGGWTGNADDFEDYLPPEKDAFAGTSSGSDIDDLG